jgi:hypothetical protein
MFKIHSLRQKPVGFRHYERGAFLLIAIALGLTLRPAQYSAVAASLTTLTPATIPLASTEIVNSGRGQYIWYGHAQQPTGQPTPYDTYWRWGWKDIEPTQGNYNFSVIDAKLADAKAHGGRFGFSIGAANAQCNGCTSMPSYLNTTTNAGTVTVNERVYNTNTYANFNYTIPDWNNANFQARWAALMSALGARYNNDPRLAYYETGGYGDWGEWHNWPYEGAYNSGGSLYPRTEMTFASAQKMIDATTSAFSKKTVLTEIIGTRITTDPTKMQDKNLNFGAWAFQYFMTKPNVGIRNACLGGGNVEQSAINAVAADQKLGATNPFGTSLPTDPAQRYKTNFVTTEWCNNIDVNTTDGTFVKGEALVRQWHVSSLSSANFQNTVDNYPATQKNAYILANKESGYRYQINTVTVPSVVNPSTSMAITSNWSNVNVAPTYDNWTVAYQLRNSSSGAVVAQTNSSLNLKALLPGATTVTDTLPIGSIPTGTYDLTASVTDPGGYLAPMNLANTGRTSGGYYPLGKVTLTAATVTPPPVSQPGGGTTNPSPSPGTGGTSSPPTGGSTPVTVVTVNGNGATPTVSGIVKVQTPDNGAATVSVDGKPVSGDVIDTTKLKNGKHQISVLENGVKKFQEVIVQNPFRLTSWVKQNTKPLVGSALILAVLGGVVYWRLFYSTRLRKPEDLATMPPSTVITPQH